MTTNKSIILAIGKRCFMHCPGCYNFFNDDTNIVTLKSIQHFGRILYEKYKINKITISGGDPLTLPNILKIVVTLKKIGFKINLDTTGIPLINDKKLAKSLLKNLDFLGLPLDGPDNKTIKLFRKGRLNYFKEIINLLNSLKGYYNKICINTVIHKGNSNALGEIAKIIYRYPVSKWQIFQFNPIGPGGYRNKEIYYLSEKKYEDSIEKLMKEAKFNKNITVEPKSIKFRNNKYILVDSSGYVWSPRKEKKSEDKRIIFGNIKEINNLENIIKLAFDY
ncbi:MAG: radical SAM protein [Candidatus Shapirobacteria bacterium]